MARIGIDFGHGGTDPGASGGGMLEKKINYNVGMELRRLLMTAGHEVVLSRTEDATMGLSARTKIFNTKKCDLVVSVHHNAGGGDGYDLIYQLDPKWTIKSKRLADMVAFEFDKLNNKHRVFSRRSTHNPKEDYHTIIALTECPAIITELAFLDTKDVLVVDTLTEQKLEAMAIFKALSRYLQAEAV
jgi:N-acetylmuramoyl-L-alanine amidase